MEHAQAREILATAHAHALVRLEIHRVFQAAVSRFARFGAVDEFNDFKLNAMQMKRVVHVRGIAHQPIFGSAEFAGEVYALHVKRLAIDFEHLFHLCAHFLTETHRVLRRWFAKFRQGAQLGRHSFIAGGVNNVGQHRGDGFEFFHHFFAVVRQVLQC